jgi:hypothetical protein
VGAPRHAAQLATWQPEPTGVGAEDGAAVGLPLPPPLPPPPPPPLPSLLRPSVDAPFATQLEPLAVCTLLKPCEKKLGGCNRQSCAPFTAVYHKRTKVQQQHGTCLHMYS